MTLFPREKEEKVSVHFRKTQKQPSNLNFKQPLLPKNRGGSYKVYETDYKAWEAYLIMNIIYSNHVSSMIKIKNKNCY